MFSSGEWNNYNCAVKLLEGTGVEAWYDWTTDIMSDAWDAAKAKKGLKAQPERMVCDALLDQTIFTGVGNVIKNESLFRIGVQPESTIGALPAKKLRALIEEARRYSFDFYRWELEGTRRRQYKVHRKGKCPSCGQKTVKKFTGDEPRSSFFCPHCQVLYR